MTEAKKNIITPPRMLEIQGTIFGNTLGKVFMALDEMDMGAVLAVHTNDP
ncbi:MAG: hypothetical protein O7A08_13740 [SAR324 cluster bacterium]|nr:hypothetical protein [SAR324 cluster bacterium]MCZ6534009.1 hypothetical protein [SAR324 cluster bacterium]MCZ6558923.1 hypothetical protein [SAR324 cluster bacterium]MCZ6629554.1 hypothetical protein [SAR324 cluster bacterium]MCZ6645569.1 hypothetical protein [SAR324 cluster bacterium]